MPSYIEKLVVAEDVTVNVANCYVSREIKPLFLSCFHSNRRESLKPRKLSRLYTLNANRRGLDFRASAMLFAPGLPTLILKLLDLRLIGRCLYSGLFYACDLRFNR